MLLLGLTGGIATGKSTVSSILASAPYSLPVIDADKIARQVVEPGTPGYDAIVAHFGPSTPDLLLQNTVTTADDKSHGSQARVQPAITHGGPPINRPALGRRVFGSENDADRKVLNGIVHPAVRMEMYRQLCKAYLRGHWAVVLDIPLLYESGWEALCGCILVVAVHEQTVQMERLMARDAHLSRQDAENRVASQWDIRDKAERCLSRGPARGQVIWNDGDKTHLRQQLDQVMRCIEVRSPRWWAVALLVCPPLAIGAALSSYAFAWLAKWRWERDQTRRDKKTS